jgi:hypothetical protein
VSCEGWTIAAAVGQLTAAIVAAFGLLFVGRQIREARKTADLQALQEFYKGATEREDKLLNTESDKKKQAFFEYLNFLEVTAAADNNGLFHKATRSIVIDKICTSIAEIQEARCWHDQFCEAVRSSTTFVELGNFMKRNREAINDRVAELQKAAETPPATP